jgi:HPt (histidine-containing phosphotransfer) domain-containing protein
LASRLEIPGDEASDGSITDFSSSRNTLKSATSPVLQEDLTADKPVISRLAINPKFKRIIINFIDKLQEQVVKLESAWKQEDWVEISELAHWLKGAAGTVGYDDFTEPASKLELFAKSQQRDLTEKMLQQVICLAKAVVPPSNEHTFETGKSSTEARIQQKQINRFGDTKSST